MRLQRWAVAAVAVLLLAGCDPNQGGATHGGDRPAAKPPAAADGGSKPLHVPDVDRPGPQADPGTCVDSAKTRSVELYAHWMSENSNTPKITWTKNGVTTPATNLHSDHNDKGRIGWEGIWSTLVNVKCKDVLAVDLVGAGGNFSSTCAIIDLGDGPVKTGETRCSAHYVVP